MRKPPAIIEQSSLHSEWMRFGYIPGWTQGSTAAFPPARKLISAAASVPVATALSSKLYG